MEHYHYLAYEQPVGEHLKYLAWAQGRPIACLAWSSAPRHLGSRDRYIGWSAEARRRNIRFIAYNTRFLILPWVRIENLASHILGRMAARISEDWQQMYAHPIYFLETFVDSERFLVESKDFPSILKIVKEGESRAENSGGTIPSRIEPGGRGRGPFGFGMAGGPPIGLRFGRTIY